MPDIVSQSHTNGLAQKRKDLSPDTEAAFQSFSRAVFANGALPTKVKQIIAVAVAHVTQCPYCIKGHTKAALRHGASQEELMEAIWVAAEMRAGGAYAHSVLAIEEMEKAAAATIRETTTRVPSISGRLLVTDEHLKVHWVEFEPPSDDAAEY